MADATEPMAAKLFGPKPKLTLAPGGGFEAGDVWNGGNGGVSSPVNEGSFSFHLNPSVRAYKDYAPWDTRLNHNYEVKLYWASIPGAWDAHLRMFVHTGGEWSFAQVNNVVNSPASSPADEWFDVLVPKNLFTIGAGGGVDWDRISKVEFTFIGGLFGFGGDLYIDNWRMSVPSPGSDPAMGGLSNNPRRGEVSS